MPISHCSVKIYTNSEHNLRHTLATRLLEKGTPFTTIAEILGHTSLESTRIYAKADVEALRGVALNPEEVNHAS
jgi:integrase/recombinase XerD